MVQYMNLANHKLILMEFIPNTKKGQKVDGFFFKHFRKHQNPVKKEL